MIEVGEKECSDSAAISDVLDNSFHGLASHFVDEDSGSLNIPDHVPHVTARIGTEETLPVQLCVFLSFFESGIIGSLTNFGQTFGNLSKKNEWNLEEACESR